MIILAVDDERLQLEALHDAIVEAMGDSIEESDVNTFNNPIEALQFAKANDVDVAFLDIEMPGIKGIDLAKEIKSSNPKTNIVFCTAYNEFALEAMKIHASGYITKPISAEAIRKEVENLRFPLQEKSGIKIQCFGNFEIYIEGKPLEFQRDKSKEVFAYLVDRKGAVCTNNEIVATLWNDDDNHISYMQKIREDIKKTINDVGYPDLVEFGWGKLRLVPEEVNCDFYEWTKGSASGINSYNGEYMKQYTWAEKTHEQIKEIRSYRM